MNLDKPDGSFCQSFRLSGGRIDSVVKLFNGQERNTFDNATVEGIRFNTLRI